MTRYVHGCWVTGAARTCEDGTKGCSREHPFTDAPEPTINPMCERVPWPLSPEQERAVEAAVARAWNPDLIKP